MAKKKEEYKPVLLSTAHIDEFYQVQKDALAELIDKKGVKSVALELVPLEKQTKEFKEIFKEEFFSKLEKFALKKGCSVYRIDSRAGWESQRILSIARDRLPPLMTWAMSASVKSILNENKPAQWKANQFHDLFNVRIKPYDVRFWVKALKLVRTLSAEEISRRFDVVAGRRSEFMLKRVQKLKPDAIIAGAFHAEQMAPTLKVKTIDLEKIAERRGFKEKLRKVTEALRQRKLQKKAAHEARRKIKQRKPK
jgi:hypothetical protein